LDYWPLGRFGDKKPRSSIALSAAAGFSAATRARSTIAALWRPIVEKLPLLAVAAVFCLVGIHGQGHAMDINELRPVGWRVGNALISYVVYLGELFCPVGLAAGYPRRPLVLPGWQIGGAILVLAAITAAALACRRQRPYLLVGWLWYVGMLVPVIGLVQFGVQAEADRFTYLPQIGLLIALAWTAADVCRSRARFRRIGAVAAACALAMLVVFAWRQTSYWRHSEALWTRALSCTAPNPIVRYNLGRALAERGRPDAAIEHFEKALEIEPHHVLARNALGAALMRCGRIDEAMPYFQKALEMKPDYADADYNLGNALARRGRFDEAVPRFEKALEIQPDYAEAHFNLGTALAHQGRMEDAIAHYRTALALARQQNKTALAEEVGAWLRSYGDGAPARRPRPSSEP
jgi:tetratricopeptide (TPR) repeat protein